MSDGETLMEAAYGSVLRDIAQEGRDIWADHPRLGPDGAAVVLAHVVGDIATVALETGGDEDPVDMSKVWKREYGKGLGYLVASSLRFMLDAGLDPNTCLRWAMEAQVRKASGDAWNDDTA